MGCDIHTWAEVLQTNHKGELEWNTVGKIWPYPYHSKNRLNTFHFYEGDEESENEVWESNDVLTEQPYSGRDYVLFAMLANVRNGGTIIPLDSPRGVPNDASSYYQYQVKKWDGDGHSHSYFSLKELEDYDWTNRPDDYNNDEFLETISRLQELKDYDNVLDVRLVFFFDN